MYFRDCLYQQVKEFTLIYWRPSICIYKGLNAEYHLLERILVNATTTLSRYTAVHVI